MAFSKKQESILQAVFSGDYDAIIADGAIRSGKTVILLIAFILWSMDTYNEINLIIAGKTVGAVQRNLIKPLKRIKYMTDNFKINYSSSKGYMTVTRGQKTNYYYVFGGVNEKSQDVVQGGTMGGAFLDEVALMPRSFVEQCIGRCSMEEALLFFSCNPEHPTHWFKQEWIDKALKKRTYYSHFVMDDNPSLSERVKDRYKRQYSGIFYDRYVRGLWTKAEGIIYRQFSDNKSQYVLDKVPDDWKLDFIRIGVDFGGNNSKTAFVAYASYNNFHDLVIIKNHRIEGDYTTEDLGTQYQAFEKDLWDKYGLWLTTRADNAEPILIRSLKTYARYSTIKPAIKSQVFGRIKFTTSMQSMRHFWVLKECNYVIDALDNAVWSEKENNVRLDDKSTAEWIDSLDAMEYSFEEDIKKFMSIVPNLKDVTNYVKKVV